MKSALFVTGRLPYPPDDGWKIRTYHLINNLVARGYVVDLISFVHEEEETAGIHHMEEVCRAVFVEKREKRYTMLNLLRGVLSRVPFSVHNYFTPEMAKVIQSVIYGGTYDFVQVEDIVMGKHFERLGHYEVPVILDMHNVESALMSRYVKCERNVLKKAYAHMTAAKLREFEKAFSNRCSAVFVCSQADADILRSRGIMSTIQVIPNGVDCDFYRPMPSHQSPNLVFVGSMDYHANISAVKYFALNIFPSLLKEYPNLVWYIVGKNPTSEVLKLASDNVIITGSVPDVRPYIAGASVIVVPLLVGGGTRLKILEAMAMGKAIISTTIGAEGIDLVAGEHVIFADSEDEFINSSLRLLAEKPLADQLGLNARHHVLQRYSWAHIGDITHLACNQLADTRR